MKSKLVIFVAFFMFSILCIHSQNAVNVVYLKNGSVLKGTIVEQIPNESLKLRLFDGSIFVFKADEIEKITLEESVSKPIEPVKQEVLQKPVDPVVPKDTIKQQVKVVAVPKQNLIPLTFSNNAIYQNGNKLSTTEIPMVLKKSELAYTNYKQAETCFVISTLSDVGFWIFTGVGILYGIQKKKDAELAMPVIGMGTCFVSEIIFKIAARNKIKQAVETYNIDIKSLSHTNNNFEINMADNGLGFKIRF